MRSNKWWAKKTLSTTWHTTKITTTAAAVVAGVAVRIALQNEMRDNMLRQIHIHPKVEKTIERMQFQDNAPKYAAQRAKRIIDSLLEGEPITSVGRFSQIKETRVKNVFKYNLGKGYRLICIKEKDLFYILQIGTHDQCDRWLDQWSKKRPQHNMKNLNCYPVRPVSKASTYHISKTLAYDLKNDDSDYLASVTQEDLRKVFAGLIH